MMRALFPVVLMLALLTPSALSRAANFTNAPFNLTFAYDQLMMAYAAYCPAAQLEAWDCIYCTNTSDVKEFKMTHIVYNETTNIYGYVGYTGSAVEVVFRGTVSTSLKNWIIDLHDGRSTPYPNIPDAFIWTGFSDGWNSIKDQVTAAFNDVITLVNATEVYFTGHSLGAALAVLAAVELGVPSGLPITAYNFGDPRVGNPAFAQYYNDNVQTSWRLVNQRDIVPHLPGKEFGFWHIAQEVWWVNSTHYYVICNDSGEDPSCSDSLGIRADSIYDHLDYLGVYLVDGHRYGCS